VKDMKTLFNQQKKYLDYFFEKLDLKKAEKILDAFIECQGNLVFSGVGKSGIIAQKLATTFASIGARSFFLPPGNALHGDIGMISEKDLLIFLSKSGETSELLHLIPFIQKRGSKIVSLHSNSHSQLAKISDLSMELPLLRELCPFNLAPTTSAVLQLIFGDVLAVAMMERKNFGLKDYILNHPAGMIGKKLTLKVNHLMLTGEAIPFCSPKDRLIDVLHEISNKCCGCLLVVDEKKNLLGIFTDGDLRRSLQSDGINAMQKTMESLMVKNPMTIEANVLAIDAMKQMEENPQRLVTVLPVTNDQQVTGILRLHDVIQAGL